MKRADMPLTGPPPREVPLKDSPLVLVLAQIRFPPIMSVQDDRFVAPFQEAIRKDYPGLRPEQGQNVLLDPRGEVLDSRPSKTIWRFHDANEVWKVALAPDFLALETSQYTSRDDFLQRLRQVLQALRKEINPTHVNRVGVRYIDQISGEDILSDLPKLVHPEIAGILATPLGHHARHTISETIFESPEEAGHVGARWGLLPAHATVDPTAVKPLDEASWLLDIDAFQEEQRNLDVNAIVRQVRGFAERIYSIFRWAVTDEFLRRYGGEP